MNSVDTSAASDNSAGLAANSSVKNLSCLECRRRKTRCDKKYPCSPCVIRGDSACCTRVQQTTASIATSQGAGANASSSSPSSKHESPPLGPDRFIAFEAERFYRLEARMDRLERYVGQNRFATAHADADSDADADADARFASTSVAATTPDDGPDALDRVEAKQPLPVGHDIQDLFEDAAMGHKLKLNSLPLGVQAQHGQSETDDEEMLEQRSADSSADVALRYARLLPANTSALVEFYFAHVDWTTRVLSPQSCSQFLQLCQMQPEQIAALPLSSAMVCCYFVVLALALHFSPSDLLEQVAISKQQASRLADTLCTGSQQLLCSSNFLQSQQLEHLACICLLGVYQHNRKEQADGQWALLGSAIKLAQNLGLARLDDGEKHSACISTEARRELGRRIWWNLVWLDWSHAAAHLGVYSIHPLHNRTKLPANVEIDRDSVTLRPADVYTHSSAIGMRMRYVTIYREIVDVSNQRPILSRAHIQRFVSKLNEVHDSTPACLRYSPGRTLDKPDQGMESVMLELMYLSRILGLHRVHQLAGFTDGTWRFARKACLSSASCIVRILALQEQSVIHQFWLVTFYLLGAAMALVMELCCAQQEDLEATSVNASLSTAISLLSNAAPASEAARNSGRMLTELLSAQDKIRQAFARLAGLQRIAHHKLDTSGTKDILLDVLHNVCSTTSSSKRKRKRASNPPSAQHTSQSSLASVSHVQVDANKADAFTGGINGGIGRSVAHLGTPASNECDWQADQSLFPSLDGILSGALSIDEWLGS
ncbi:uncharacterized protein UHOD_11795 [Ustilago sp. UG-2017b]|nr:uncharacterized protein UHOD_11795 [Ustilago sp. UG-2017b]